jgi:hypothetical protein
VAKEQMVLTRDTRFLALLGGLLMRYGIGLLVLAVAAAGCRGPIHNNSNLPPAERLLRPGPGVGGPGPGVMTMQPAMPPSNQTSQVKFGSPESMLVAWDVGVPGSFDSQPLQVPGRYNFPQGAIYRLKLTNVPGRPGVELYPTLEVAPAMPRTAAFLAHNAIPVQFTEEDFDQVLSGNFVTKVLYLPDPEYQELALAGVETLVSTRLDPGVDPIIEADRRGAILAVIRLGNKDLETPSAMNGGAEVVPAGYAQGAAPGMAPVGPLPCPNAAMPGAPYAGMGPTNYISGVTGPQYGMPMSGTPIGLVGPPHVPLGTPAGLQKHTMVNHTREHIPGPEEKVRVDVKQRPGLSYPEPANHARIVESDRPGRLLNRQPLGTAHQQYVPDSSCPPAPEGGAGEVEVSGE